MSKPILYVDIDDTFLANVYYGSGFDLRPGTMTYLRVLSKLFNCYWLTSWPYNSPKTQRKAHAGRDIVTMMRNLYGTSINQEFQYAQWAEGHPIRKAGYVLDPVRCDLDWWWLEDPITQEEYNALVAAGKLNRYIRVEPQGQWGFLDAINELFRRAGITENDLRKVQAKPEWFDRGAVEAGRTSKDRTRHVLEHIQLLSRREANPETALDAIRQYVHKELTTIYPLLQ